MGAGLLGLALLLWLTAWLARRELKSRLFHSLQECQSWSDQLAQLTQQKKNLSQDLATADARAVAQERRFDILTTQFDHQRSRYDELKQSEQLLQQQCQGLASTNQEVRAELTGQSAQIAGQATKIDELKGELLRWQEKWEQLNQLNAELKEKNIQLTSYVDEKERGMIAQQALFEQQKQDLTERFQNLANDILDKKTQILATSNSEGLRSVINPFQQTIDAFKKEVQDIHHRETTQRGELKKELEQLKVLNQQITAEAHQLSTALRGQKKLQGNWGELVLENALDRSGLLAGKDYQREVSFTTEDGRQRPDAIVYLPQGKHLIIDAKVSLNAYTQYVNSDNDGDRERALREHGHAMRARIQELAQRNYDKIPELNSPELVFMFVPIESAFVEALKADDSLFQYALDQHVLVATPTTLLTSLNIVRQLWRYEDQNKHTLALAQKAEGVFNKLNGFLKSFENVKAGLEKANEAYSKAEGQLTSGKGNLVKQVAEFKNLAPSIKQELPDSYTEKANLEVDFLTSTEEHSESGLLSPSPSGSTSLLKHKKT